MKWVGRPDIDRVAIGDEVSLPICGVSQGELVNGNVIYIHPKKRFFTVEFEGTHIRESFCAYGPLS